MNLRSTMIVGLALATLPLSGCGGGADETTDAMTGDAPAVPDAEQTAAPDAAQTGEPAAASDKSAAPAEPEPAPVQTVAAADPPQAYLQCRTCHAVEPGKHGVGPSLHGIFGKPAAQAQGFNYSEAMKNSGLTWDRATLDEWIEAPMKKVPGTRMVLGMPDPEKRKAVIDYIETLK